MGELAGGEGVRRARGREEFAFGSQPSLPSLLESGNCSRTVGLCAGRSPSQGHSSGSAAHCAHCGFEVIPQQSILVCQSPHLENEGDCTQETELLGPGTLWGVESAANTHTF